MPFVDVSIQKAFFDTRAVQKAIDRETRQALSKGAAAVRGEQRASIKFRKDPKKSSPQGSPPFAHRRGKYSPKYILFGYDARTESAAIGMVKLPQSSVSGRTAFPEVMEKGGTVVIRKKGQKTRRVKIRRRPSAVPALDRAISSGKVIEPWGGVIRP